MSAVPDHDILMLDELAVDELINAGFGAGAGSAIIDLVAVVLDDPQVAAS